MNNFVAILIVFVFLLQWRPLEPSKAGVHSAHPGQGLLFLPSSLQLPDPSRRALPAVQPARLSADCARSARQQQHKNASPRWKQSLSCAFFFPPWLVLSLHPLRSAWRWRTGSTCRSLRRTPGTLSTGMRSTSCSGCSAVELFTSRPCPPWWASRSSSDAAGGLTLPATEPIGSASRHQSLNVLFFPF